jgi:hypothetical protein
LTEFFGIYLTYLNQWRVATVTASLQLDVHKKYSLWSVLNGDFAWRLS